MDKSSPSPRRYRVTPADIPTMSLSFRLSEPEYEALRLLAMAERRSISNQARHIIALHLETAVQRDGEAA